MIEDDPDARKKPGALKNLEPMSIEELENYITALREEILRAEQSIVKKKSQRDIASSFFKTSN